jgi:hypothetical protein
MSRYSSRRIPTKTLTTNKKIKRRRGGPGWLGSYSRSIIANLRGRFEDLRWKVEERRHS